MIWFIILFEVLNWSFKFGTFQNSHLFLFRPIDAMNGQVCQLIYLDELNMSHMLN